MNAQENDQASVDNKILDGHEVEKASSGSVGSDASVIDFEPNDPIDAINWSPARKWMTMMLVAIMSFGTGISTSVIAPAVPQLMREFHSANRELGIFVVSATALGFAFGSLGVPALSEIYGRSPIYYSTNFAFTAFSVACGFAPSLRSLIVLRFFQGLAGSAPLAVGAGTIADIFHPQDRAKAMSVYGLGLTLGPLLGPICGGALANKYGWRWTMYFQAIVGGVIGLLTLTIHRETLSAVNLEHKVHRLRKSTGNLRLRSKLAFSRSPKQIVVAALTRPMKLLFRSPAVFLPCLASAIMFSYFYILITDFAYFFQSKYGFNTLQSGLCFLGLGVGNILGLVLFAGLSDRYVAKKIAQGKYVPEHRLFPIIIGGPIVCAGLLWYGWSGEKGLHFMHPVVASGVFGFGFVPYIAFTINYLIDAWRQHAASAVSANVFMRCLIGALVPLVARKLYDGLGFGWGNSLLAFIALATTPFPVFFIKYGEGLRAKYPVKL